MGREIKRVALNFNWPMKERWIGFLLPNKYREVTCTACYGSGSTPAMQWIERMALMLDQLVKDVEVQAKGEPMHPWLAEDSYPPVDRTKELYRSGMWVTYEPIRPSEDILEFAQALIKDDENERRRTLQRGPMSENRHTFSRAFLRLAELPEKWGWCPTCVGHGTVEQYEGQRAEGEAWEPYEPPEGEGWQVWETTTEGSPISPVFATREELIEFLMSDKYFGFGTSPTPLTREQAEAFAGYGHSLASMVVTDGKVINGDAAVHELSKDSDA